MRGHAVLALTSVMCAFLSARAQQAAASHDHNFACLADGLAKNKSFGCLALARPIIGRVPDGPVFWHLSTYRTRREANAAKHDGDAVVTVDGRVWLSSIGPRADARRHGTHMATIGPIVMPNGDGPHRVELYYVVMPAHEHTQVHTHPGPEAWYVLEGEQCLDTPNGVQRVKAGDSVFAAVQAGVPMQLTNSGTSVRRALFIVVHDTTASWTTPSDWKPTGACATSRR